MSLFDNGFAGATMSRYQTISNEKEREVTQWFAYRSFSSGRQQPWLLCDPFPHRT